MFSGFLETSEDMGHTHPASGNLMYRPPNRVSGQSAICQHNEYRAASDTAAADREPPNWQRAGKSKLIGHTYHTERLELVLDNRTVFGISSENTNTSRTR